MEAPIPDAPSTIKNKGIIKKEKKEEGGWIPVYQQKNGHYYRVKYVPCLRPDW